MKIDVERYVGIPYVSRGRSREGCDCFGLLFIAYADQGIVLPSYAADYVDAAEAAETKRAIERNLSDWVQVEVPEEGDAVLLRRPMHIGIYLGGGLMLNVRRGVNACVERLDSPEYARRIVGYYRRCQS